MPNAHCPQHTRADRHRMVIKRLHHHTPPICGFIKLLRRRIPRLAPPRDPCPLGPHPSARRHRPSRLRDQPEALLDTPAPRQVHQPQRLAMLGQMQVGIAQIGERAYHGDTNSRRDLICRNTALISVPPCLRGECFKPSPPSHRSCPPRRPRSAPRAQMALAPRQTAPARASPPDQRPHIPGPAPPLPQTAGTA